MVQITCPGCNKKFLPNSWSVHLSKTKNPPCQAIYRKQRSYVPGSHWQNFRTQQDPTSTDSEPPNTPSTHNHYNDSDYLDGDFLGWNDSGNDDRDNDSDISSSSYSDSTTESTTDGMEMDRSSEPSPLDFQHTNLDSEAEISAHDAMDDERGRVMTSEEVSKVREEMLAIPIVREFPSHYAGAPVSHSTQSIYSYYQEQVGATHNNIYAPFRSKCDWEIAQWVKVRGPGSTAVSELLGIDGVQQLELSYKNMRELNKIVDSLPRRPKFMRGKISIGEELVELYYRDVLECVQALYSDPEFTPHMIFKPEKQYVDQENHLRVYGDMHTGDWWWNTQKAVERNKPGATIIPIIISSDKTQLTLFRNKAAYPVYLTLGNLPKEIRRKPARQGHILLGYLPTSRLESMPSGASRRRALANLFHACIATMLEPLKNAGLEGVYMQSGDGIKRRTHPIVAAFVGDYPEQLLVTCCKTNRCPKCEVEPGSLGENMQFQPRNLMAVLEALDALEDGPTAYTKACADAGIKPVVHPFWESLPYLNIFVSITPDILHQLYQGLVKHILSWLIDAFGASEIDARCRRLPPNHNLRHFSKGITTLSRVSGQEHGDMCRILLGLIVDLQLPDNRSPTRLVRCVRSFLDFLYIAQLPSQTTTTLDLLEEALTTFHNNKNIFVDLGIRTDFNIPKLHSLQHYTSSIRLFGTTDNYNTEYSERLHIDLAKDAYRATNHKNEYVQMSKWLERKEKIYRHGLFIDWLLAGQQHPSMAPPQMTLRTHIKMARHPTVTTVPLNKLGSEYGACDFRQELSLFVAHQNFPHFSRNQHQNVALNVILPFQHIPVFHKIKFWLSSAQPTVLNAPQVLDVAHVRPQQGRKNRDGQKSGRFDTVLVRLNDDRKIGVQRYRVAQVRVVFRLPQKALDFLFRDGVDQPKHLAYVEWFSEFRHNPEANHLLYKISRSLKDGRRVASVIPVADIDRTVVLFPQFGPVVPREWSSENILDKCSTFYVNPFTDRHSYLTIS